MILALIGGAAAFELTPLILNGDSGEKFDIVIIGEGYAAADHDAFVEQARTVAAFIAGDCPIDGNCPLAQASSAFNIWLLEVPSPDSGAMHGWIDSDGEFNRTTAYAESAFGVATADGSTCWFAWTGWGLYDLDTVLAADAPFYDSALLILNTNERGGCNGGDVMTLTASEPAGVYRHEFGHNIGGLGDEYFSKGTYSSTSPDAWRASSPNLAVTSDRTKVPWADFIAPGTDVPQSAESGDVSAFEGGAAKFDVGVWRPVWQGTMFWNGDDYGEPEFHRMMGALAPYRPAPFANLLPGHFGYAADSLVQHQGSTVQPTMSLGKQLVPVNLVAGPVDGWDHFTPGDRFTVADFDSDGFDDLFVFNGTDYDVGYAAILRSDGEAGFDMSVSWGTDFSGWGALAAHDQFIPGDFNGDGYTDLVLFNGEDWPTPYLAVAYGSGPGFTVDVLYATYLPGWQMSAGDSLHAADTDGDGRDELVIANFTSWSTGYLATFAFDEGEIAQLAYYPSDLPGWDGFAPHDEVRVGDVNGDGADDLILSNTLDWDQGYLGLFAGSGGGFTYLARHDGEVFGWDALAVHDLLAVADVNGDECDDLAIANGLDWDQTYAGMLVSDCAGGLTGWWNTGDELSLGVTANSRLIVGEFTGDEQEEPALVVDDRWLVRLRSHGTGYSTDAVYLDWIANYDYHASGLW